MFGDRRTTEGVNYWTGKDRGAKRRETRKIEGEKERNKKQQEDQ